MHLANKIRCIYVKRKPIWVFQATNDVADFLAKKTHLLEQEKLYIPGAVKTIAHFCFETDWVVRIKEI